MQVLYVRVSDEVSEYVREVAGRSGLSLSKTADILLRACKDQGMEITLSALGLAERDGG